jgi:hypothetical protein
VAKSSPKATDAAKRRVVLDAESEVQFDSATLRLQLQRSLASKCDKPFELSEQYVGLSAPNLKFRNLVSRAIVSCVIACVTPQQKRGDARKQLNRVSKAAATMASGAVALQAALADVACQRQLDRGLDHLDITPSRLANDAAQYDQLSAIANRAAKIGKLIDKGGAPKMVAFNALVTGLARAFQIATGRAAKVTRNSAEDTYGGPFLALVEAVLPLAEGLTNGLGISLRRPRSRLALGKYVSEQTRAGKKRHVLYTA